MRLGWRKRRPSTRMATGGPSTTKKTNRMKAVVDMGKEEIKARQHLPAETVKSYSVLKTAAGLLFYLPKLLSEAVHVLKLAGKLPQAGFAAIVVFPAHGHFLDV
jgi:hypothetical protein